MKNLGDRIRLARVACGLNQRQLAEAIGVTSQNVSQWESGKIKTLQGGNLTKAAEVLGVLPKWLIFGKGPRAAKHGTEELPSLYLVAPPARGQPNHSRDAGAMTEDEREMLHGYRALPAPDRARIRAIIGALSQPPQDESTVDTDD